MTAPAPTILGIALPVRTARVITDFLVPDGAGGWMYGAETGPLHIAAQWAITHLGTGAYVSGYAVGADHNTTGNNQSVHQQLGYQNQLRTLAGRIMLPENKGCFAYWDPGDQLVHQLPQIVDLVYDPDHWSAPYWHKFGFDGNLYIAHQTDTTPPCKPPCYVIDPVTLVRKVLGHFGFTRNSFSYPYDGVPDPTPASGAPQGFIVMCVGKDPWELVAMNIATGAQTLLFGPVPGSGALGGLGNMKIQVKPEGVTCIIDTDIGKADNVRTQLWCVDGQTYPYTPGYDPNTLPFPHRDVTGVSNPLINPPELNTDAGAGLIRWREAGSSGPFISVPYTIDNAGPIPIESILPLASGALYGFAEQYNGIFKLPAASVTTEWTGPLVTGGPDDDAVSQPVMIQLRSGVVLAIGYPNAKVLEIDPTADILAGTNPVLRGNFGASGMKYCYAAIEHANGKIYACGRREREGVGGGIGKYNPTTHLYEAGTFANLNHLTPRGLTALPSGLVVLSGVWNSDPLDPGASPTASPLVLYTEALVESDRQVVRNDLLDTGKISTTATPSIIAGLSATAKLAYRWDTIAKRLAGTADLSSYVTVGPAAMDEHGNFVCVLGGTQLATVNVETLAVTVIADLSAIVAEHGAIDHIALEGGRP